MKPNGQDEQFSGYGGIEDLSAYVPSEHGPGWSLLTQRTLPDLESFTQDVLEPGAPNCTLVSITRILQYHGKRGYVHIPADLGDIYKTVREVGASHGYNPLKSGILRDLFIYTPFEIDNMVREMWGIFQYPNGHGNNHYFRKWDRILEQVDHGNPLLLNIAFGDYAGHTVTVAGYAVYAKNGFPDRCFVQLFDGWSSTIRSVDLKKLGWIPASITRIIPPDLKE